MFRFVYRLENLPNLCLGYTQMFAVIHTFSCKLLKFRVGTRLGRIAIIKCLLRAIRRLMTRYDRYLQIIANKGSDTVKY